MESGSGEGAFEEEEVDARGLGVHWEESAVVKVAVGQVEEKIGWSYWLLQRKVLDCQSLQGTCCPS